LELEELEIRSSCCQGTSGNPSIFSTITSSGGGGKSAAVGNHHLDYLEVLEEVQEMKMANHHILRVQEIHHQ
jgi:hypothetical protein